MTQIIRLGKFRIIRLGNNRNSLVVCRIRRHICCKTYGVMIVIHCTLTADAFIKLLKTTSRLFQHPHLDIELKHEDPNVEIDIVFWTEAVGHHLVTAVTRRVYG